MKAKNIELEVMMNSLTKLLPRRDKIGYIAARNYRIINNALTEYLAFKADLIKKYGENDKEKNVITINPDTENYNKFIEEFEVIAGIDAEVSLMTISYSEVIDILNGEEILDVDWMLTDE